VRRCAGPRGTFVVQDEASQLVPLLAGSNPGRRVLDACASPGGKTVALAAAMGMDRTTLGRNILPLARDGLITIDQGEADLRSKVVNLTKSGAEKQRAGLKHWQAAQAGFEQTFGLKRSAELRALLGAVVASEFA